MAIALSNKHWPLAKWLDVGGFLRWWGRGLLLCLPETLRQRLTFTRARVVVLASREDIRIYDERGGHRRELGRLPRNEVDAGHGRIINPGERQVVLCLAPEQVLSTTVTLPLAAENNLRQAVGFEIDRLTPFSADKVYYDVQLLERQPANRTLRAQLAVVLRSTLTPLLGQLQGLGLAPERVEIEGDQTGLDLLPSSYRRRILRAGQRWRRILLFLIVLTALGIAILPLWQQRSVVVDMIPMVDAAEREAQEVISLRERLDNAAESSLFLLEKRRQTVRLVDILNELTVLLPDNAYLEQFSLRNGQAELRGQSGEATALISVLEESELLADVTFRSPVVKDNRSGLDRFVISARVVPGVTPILPQAVEPDEQPTGQAADKSAVETTEPAATSAEPSEEQSPPVTDETQAPEPMNPAQVPTTEPNNVN